jgi:AraC-like DNA-binding protein
MSKDLINENQVKLWRSKQIQGLDVLRAGYKHHSFRRHIHETYVIGVIEQGAVKNDYRGSMHTATTNDIILVNPGEVHTGQTVEEVPWEYRAMYPPAELLSDIVSQLDKYQAETANFISCRISNRPLAKMLQYFLLKMEKEDDSLELQTLFLDTISQLIVRHSDRRFQLRSAGKEHLAVKQTKDYILENFFKNISLKELSEVAYLSPFHLLRVFRKEIGLPPHEFLLNVRIEKSKTLLNEGHSITQVSYDTGFADQSHFSRCFKQIVGVPPGQYQRTVN